MNLQHFQEVEEGHLNQMRNFLHIYVNILCNNYEAMGQVMKRFLSSWTDSLIILCCRFMLI